MVAEAIVVPTTSGECRCFSFFDSIANDEVNAVDDIKPPKNPVQIIPFSPIVFISIYPI